VVEGGHPGNSRKIYKGNKKKSTSTPLALLLVASLSVKTGNKSPQLCSKSIPNSLCKFLDKIANKNPLLLV
jgi:hypothetical protein